MGCYRRQHADDGAGMDAATDVQRCAVLRQRHERDARLRRHVQHGAVLVCWSDSRHSECAEQVQRRTSLHVGLQLVPV
jgi:hypothetical protein